MGSCLFGKRFLVEAILSGIIGRLYPDPGARDDAAFDHAFRAMSDYGADGGSVVHDQALSIGLHYLRIRTDAPEHHEPHQSERLIVAADIVLDNRMDVLAGLGERQDASDFDLIAALFEKVGTGLVRRIDGDYALAIYDTASRKLILISDHIGSRPLYWRRHRGSVIFGTDIRALTQFRDMPWKIDERAMARFVMSPNRMPEKTLFEGLETVPPGHVVEISGEGVTSSRWWDPRNAPDIRLAKQCDYVDQFRARVELAVRTRSDTVGRLGSHISGGIDSGSVTYLAGSKLHRAYCWAPAVSEAFPDMGPRDERRNVARICDSIGATVRHTTMTGESFFRFLDRPIEFLGSADLADEIPILELAKEDGIRVMLSGWGGDEAFSAHGFGHAAKLIRRGRWIQAFRAVRRLAGGRRHPKIFGPALLHWGLAPLAPGWLYNSISPFQDAFLGGAMASPHLARLAPDPPKWNGEDIRLIASPAKYLCSLILMGHLGTRMASWAAWSAPHQLQYRYPLTDRALLEYVVGIPDELYTADGYGRYLPRTALKGELPDYLTKHDQASEALRGAASLECWSRICAADADGLLPAESNWIDMPQFRKSLYDKPDKMDIPGVRQFAKINFATKILSLEKRWQ